MFVECEVPPEYKNTVKRKGAIANISEKMGFTEEIIKKKIASIRSTYLLEKKKIKDSHHSGTGTDDVYHPTLPWFQHMTFLNDVIIARKTLDNLESQQTQNDESEQDNQSPHNVEATVTTISYHEGHVHDPAPPMETPSQAPIQLQKKRKHKSMTDTSVDASVAAVDNALNKLSTMTNQDMFDNFGNLVASQLRSIPLEHALQLQTEITTLINNRLLIMHRGTSASSSFRQNSQPSSSNSLYSTNFTEHTAEYSQPVIPADEYSNEPQAEDVFNNTQNYETTAIITQALNGLLQ